MLIGLKKRFIFVANTKTGSTSIEQALLPYAEIHHAGDPRRKHVSLREGLEVHAKALREARLTPRDFLKFGVMRDPVEWILSWYRYRRGNDVEAPLPKDMSFAEFWALQDWNILRKGTPFLQQDSFVGDDGRILADIILPFDRLTKGFAEICKIIDVDCALPHTNVSRVLSTGDIPLALLQEVREFYAKDYALYDRLETLNAAGFERLKARH